MSSGEQKGIGRRAAIRMTGALLAAGAGGLKLGRAAPAARADQLRPNDPLYHFDQYDAIVSRDLTIRQVFEWSNLSNRELWANAVNLLNAFQFSYDVPADQIQVVVQAYSGSTPAIFDDFIWQKYALGQLLNVHDAQGNPATANPFLHSRLSIAPNSTPPSDQTDPYYFDSTIEGLQRRGVLFLVCNNSLNGTASLISSSGTNPDNLTAGQVASEIQGHLVPGSFLVPAGVGELVRLQDKSYRLIVNS